MDHAAVGNKVLQNSNNMQTYHKASGTRLRHTALLENQLNCSNPSEESRNSSIYIISSGV